MENLIKWAVEVMLIESQIKRSTTENSFSDEVFSSGSSSDGMVDDSDYINDSKEKGVFIR